MKNRSGSAYLLVIGALLIASFAASLLLRNLSHRQFRIASHRSRLAVRAAADAALVHAFHRLKGRTFDKASLLGSLEGGRLGTVSYRCTVSADPASQTLSLEGEAREGKVAAHRRAVATFRLRDRRYRWALRYLP